MKRYYIFHCAIRQLESAKSQDDISGKTQSQIVNHEREFAEHHVKPLGFFSKKLKPAETRYSTFGRELLGIYLAIKHF